jgi:hypothetical protein
MVQSDSGGESMRDLLERDPRLSGLASQEGGLEKLFDLDFYLRHVDEIFARFEIFDGFE